MTAPLTRRARRRRRAAARQAARTALLGLLALGVAQGTAVHGTAPAPTAEAPAEEIPASQTPANPLTAATPDAAFADLRGATESSRSDARAGTITLVADGTTTALPLAGETLADTLAAADVVVDADDIVSAHLGGPIADGDTVTIQRVTSEIVTEETGAGRDSATTETFEVTYVDGVETARTMLASAESLGSLDAAIAAGDNVEVGRIIAAQHGWTGDQWQCLYNLWQKESNWSTTADNPTSSAYGIPQALPGRKMASAGADWATNPATQVTWGLGYIADRYGSPCGAWGHSQSHNWY